jgi:hypothetical protein
MRLLALLLGVAATFAAAGWWACNWWRIAGAWWDEISG